MYFCVLLCTFGYFWELLGILCTFVYFCVLLGTFEYRCYYPHWSRDSVSSVWGIFFAILLRCSFRACILSKTSLSGALHCTQYDEGGQGYCSLIHQGRGRRGEAYWWVIPGLKTYQWMSHGTHGTARNYLKYYTGDQEPLKEKLNLYVTTYNLLKRAIKKVFFGLNNSIHWRSCPNFKRSF